MTKEYDDDLSLHEIRAAARCFAETWRVSCARRARGIPTWQTWGRKPYIPLSDHVTMLMLYSGFLMRGEIIWSKGVGGCLHGVGVVAVRIQPALCHTDQKHLVFSKGSFKRSSVGRRNTIGREAFMEWN